MTRARTAESADPSAAMGCDGIGGATPVATSGRRNGRGFGVHIPGRLAESITRRTVAWLLALGLLVAAAPVHARGCASPANVGCTIAECEALQAVVTATKGAQSCRNLAGCTLLRIERQKWLDHYIARSTINGRCFAGGDLGHQIAAANAIEHVYRCEARMALPEPVGCSDPCP